MSEKYRVHPETGQRLRRDVRPMTISYAALSRQVDVPGWYPEDRAGDAIHSGADLAAIEAARRDMQAAYAQHVRQVRKSLGLTQEAAGTIVGGGKRAFQKYESGKMPPSDSAVAVIELLYRDPAAVEVLKRLPGRALESA